MTPATRVSSVGPGDVAMPESLAHEVVRPRAVSLAQDHVEGGRPSEGLRLLGELDHAAAQEVMPGIEDAVEEYLPRRCVLDLSGLSFMDSSGIAVILKTDRLLRQTGGALALCGVPRQVRRVLDVAGLTNIVPVLEDRAKECEQC